MPQRNGLSTPSTDHNRPGNTCLSLAGAFCKGGALEPKETEHRYALGQSRRHVSVRRRGVHAEAHDVSALCYDLFPLQNNALSIIHVASQGPASVQKRELWTMGIMLRRCCATLHDKRIAYNTVPLICQYHTIASMRVRHYTHACTHCILPLHRHCNHRPSRRNRSCGTEKERGKGAHAVLLERIVPARLRNVGAISSSTWRSGSASYLQLLSKARNKERHVLSTRSASGTTYSKHL